MIEVKLLNYPEHWPACSASQEVRGEGAAWEGWRGVFSFWSRDWQQQLLLALKAALWTLGMAKRWMQKAPAAKRPKLREGGGQKHGQGPRKTLASEGQLSCRKQNNLFDSLHPIKGWQSLDCFIISARETILHQFKQQQPLLYFRNMALSGV